MKDIPDLTNTQDVVVIRDGSRFLAELSKDGLIKSLVPHTCDAVNTDQKREFHVRISQTRNHKKIIVSLTRGALAVCFMVKPCDRRNHDLAMIVTAIEQAAQSCELPIINLVILRTPAPEPVQIKPNTRSRFRRLRRTILPCRQRKIDYKLVAAT